MSVGSVNSRISSSTVSLDVETQIRVLQQKLVQLSKNKTQAAKDGDTDKVKRLEAQIEAIQRQIEQLEQKQAARQEDTEVSSNRAEGSADPNLGQYVDTLA